MNVSLPSQLIFTTKRSSTTSRMIFASDVFPTPR